MLLLHRHLACFIAVLAVSFKLFATEASDELPILDLGARVHPVIGEAGMVVARDAVASQVGADILAQGGNAVDAAVATGFALAVTFPQAGNLGGGGFMLVHLAAENRTIALDYREQAPAAAHRKMFLDWLGRVDGERARASHQSAGVPGTVAGLVHAQQQYGSLPLEKVIQPAIELAEKGFEVGYPLAFSLQRRGERLKQNPAAAGYYFKPDGSGYQAGDTLVQKDLAWTLKQIAQQGADGFYKGAVADRIVAEMERGNG